MSEKPGLAGYEFSQTSATLANGSAIDTGFIDMAAADKYQLSFVASATGLTIETQSKAVEEDAALSSSFTYSSSTFFNASYPVRQRFVRLILTNNTGSGVTDVNLEVKTSFGSSDKLVTAPLGTSVTNATPAGVVKAVLVGQKTDGTFCNLDLSDNGQLSVTAGVTTTFNEQKVTEADPFIEGSATYGLIPANFREFTAAGGSTGTENRLFKVSSGTSVGGYGAIQSFRATPHRVGKTVTCKFSGYFPSNVADNWQGIGLISLGEELSFGYNGTAFGVWNRYGGLPEVRTLTVTTAAAANTDLTLTLNSVAYTIPLTTGTVQHNAYEIEDWLRVNQSVWAVDQLDDTVIISALSDGAKSGTYTYSHATSTGTIVQNRGGVTKTSEHISQADWNGDEYPATLDPSKGNVYTINYQDMHYGVVEYAIANPSTGYPVIVHRLEVPNTITVSQLPNPSLRAGVYSASTGATTNIDVYAGDFSIDIDGKSSRTRNPRAADSEQSITTTTETTLITLRNRSTYNYYPNQVEIDPLIVTVSNETNRSARIRVRSTTNVGVEQNFQLAGTNLVGDIDETAVAFSGGRLLAAASLAPSGETEIDLQSLQIALPPSLYLVVTVERDATGGSNTFFDTAITWYEDL